jgi:hypothetical protein
VQVEISYLLRQKNQLRALWTFPTLFSTFSAEICVSKQFYFVWIHPHLYAYGFDAFTRFTYNYRFWGFIQSTEINN